VFTVAIENAFDFGSSEYQLLLDRSAASAFQSLSWLGPLYRVLAPALGAEPLILVAREAATGALVMVLPLVRRRRHGLRLIEFADLEVSDYACAVCEPAWFEALAADDGAQQALRRLLQPFDLLRIKKAPEWTTPAERLLRGARRTAFGASAHTAALYAPFEQWQAQELSSTLVKELRKKRRQLDRMGAVRLDHVDEAEAQEELLGHLQDLRGRRFPDDLLGQAGYLDFYRAVTRAGAKSGFARGYSLSLDGERLGGVWGLSWKRRFLVLISGFDYAAYRRQSLGSLAFEEVARDCILRGDEVLDFGMGDEAYKGQFGAKPIALYTLSAYGTGLGFLAGAVASGKAALTRVAEPAA